LSAGLSPADRNWYRKKTPARKILVIEDEGDMCLLINILLNRNELIVDHVKNITDAMEYLHKEQPSLVLLDNRLPDGLGIDLIIYIKAKYPGIKIIMISGVDLAARDMALEIGADLFLSKPFTKQQLDASIKTLLN
jgi:DNA-binding response OmpR family regulator